MTSPYDGTEFVGLDEDGLYYSTGTSEQPMDTWLAHAIRSNLLYVGKHYGSKMCVGERVANATVWTSTGSNDHRPMAGLRKSAFLTIPWYFNVGCAKITADGVVRIDSQGGTSQELTIILEVLYPQERLSAQSRTAYADSTGGTYEFGNITQSVTFTPVRQEGWGMIRLWVESELDTTTGTTTNGLSADGAKTSTASTGYFTDSAGGNQPDTASREVMASQENADAANIMDHFYDAGAYDTDTGIVSPAPISVGLTNEKYITYAQFRGIQISEEYELLEPQLTALEYAAEIAGQRLRVRSQADVKLALAPDFIRQRKRCYWAGPRGVERGSEGAWPGGYWERWPRFNASTGGTILDAVILPDVDNPTIEACFLVAGIHATQTFYFTAGDGDSFLADVIDAHSDTTYTLTMTVQEMEDGDTGWGDATSLLSTTQNARVSHYPTTPRAMVVSPMIAGWYWMLYGDTGTTSYDWWYREGQMYENDYRFMQMVRISGDITWTVGDNPVRVKVTAAEAGTPNRSWGISADNTAANLHVAVIGSSLWARP